MPFTATEQEPSDIGSWPGAIQSPAAVWLHRFWPNTVANDPGAMGWVESKEAPFTTVIWAEAMPRPPERVNASRTTDKCFFTTNPSLSKNRPLKNQSQRGHEELFPIQSLRSR